MTMQAPSAHRSLIGLKKQLDQPWLLDYLEIARRNDHSLTLVQTVLPSGAVGDPKLTIATADTRSRKRR